MKKEGAAYLFWRKLCIIQWKACGVMQSFVMTPWHGIGEQVTSDLIFNNLELKKNNFLA